jgi:hypothetical protein
MCQAKNIALDATWQKDNNVFCFNLYINDKNYKRKKFLKHSVCPLSANST